MFKALMITSIRIATKDKFDSFLVWSRDGFQVMFIKLLIPSFRSMK